MTAKRTPVSYERITLQAIRDAGGKVLVTKRHDIESEPARVVYTTQSGEVVRSEIMVDLISAGFVEPEDGGLFGDDPTSYRVA